MRESSVPEKKKTIQYCRIMENFIQKTTVLVSVGSYVIRIFLFNEVVVSNRCSHMFSAFLEYIFMASSFNATYFRHMLVFIFSGTCQNKWHLKPPCQT